MPPDMLARACSADACAQAAIYAAVAPATFALIRRLAGNRTLAEDLFQETMMTLFQRLSTFRGEAPLGAWVRQIAVSKCLMYLRSPWHRARLRLCMEDDSAAQVLLPATPAPKAEVLDMERALASLTPTARAVDVSRLEQRSLDPLQARQKDKHRASSPAGPETGQNDRRQRPLGARKPAWPGYSDPGE